ncbi:hypothetical protein Tco_0016138 [Tanacetum coccineum]
MGTMWCLYDPTPSVQIFYDHVNPTTRRTIDQSASGKLRDKNAEESWVLIEDLALYDNKSWNDPRDFAKSVKAISLPQDVPITSDHRLIKLENQVQRLMEAHLASNPPVQVNQIASSCKIFSGPHDTQYCLENPEQAFVDFRSSRDNKVGGKPFTTNQRPRNFNETTNAWKDKPNFNWARTQNFSSRQNGSFSTCSSNMPSEPSSYQTKLERVVYERFDNAPTRDIAKHSMACVNAVSHDHLRNGAPPKKGIKSPSKLLSPKYQSQSSLEQQNRNSSSPKRVHFANTITIIRKEDENKEEEIVEPNAIKDNNHNTIVKIKEKVGGELSGFEIVTGEGKSRDIKRDDLDDKARGDTKEVNEADEENKESEEKDDP